MRISKQTLDHFRSKYSGYITKETESQILLHCLNPNHVDNKRSAVMYKDTGLIVCPVCGRSNIKEVIKGTEYEYSTTTRVRSNTQTSVPFTFPTKYRKSAYYYDYKGDLVFASFKDGVCVGLHERVFDHTRHCRIYRFRGNSSFRPESRYITESTTDAVRLIEANIDAGSICSVSNWQKVKQDQIYVPQLDDIGIETGLNIQKKGIMVVWWNLIFDKKDLVGVKDICDLDENKFSKILSLFNVTKEVSVV